MKNIIYKVKQSFENDKKLYRNIFNITWPAFMELFLSSSLAVINTVMVGHLNPAAISGVGITGQPFNLMIALFSAVNVGTTALVSWNFGAGKTEKALDIVKQVILFNMVIGMVLTVVGYYFAEHVMTFLSTDPQTITYATDYFRYGCIGILFQAVTMGITASLRGYGKTSYPMVYNLGANILNVVLSYPLIYGKFGLPRMEVVGAAIGVTVSRFVACAAALWIVFFFKASPIKIKLKSRWRFDVNIIKSIFSIGMPAAGEQFVIQSGLLFFSRIVNSLGVEAFAAHQIGMSVNGIVFSISQAFSVATTSLVGRSVGADDYNLAEKYTNLTKQMARVITGILAVFLIIFARPICALYTNDQVVIDVGSSVFFFIALVQFVQSVQMSTSGALRGSGDTMYPLYASIFGIWIFRVVAAYLFVSVLHLGLFGAWLAFFLDQATRSLTVTLRFKSGKWKQMKAIHEAKNKKRKSLHV